MDQEKRHTAYGILRYSVVLGLLNDGRVGDAHLCTIEILGSYISVRQIEVNSST